MGIASKPQVSTQKIMNPAKPPASSAEPLPMKFFHYGTRGSTACIITYKHCPPCIALTPFHTIAIAALLNVGHHAPNIPNAARFNIGKPMWYFAPARPLATMTKVMGNCPTNWQPNDSHIERPRDCAKDTAYHVETVDARVC